MDLKERTHELLQNFNLNPENDQHFLIDNSIIDEIIEAAQLKKEDIVLEIGSGTGNITEQLAKKVKKVIAYEIDEQFKVIKMPSNVEMHYETITPFSKTPFTYTKIVANIPYQLSEPLLHFLCTAQHVEVTVLVMPKNFAQNIHSHPIFSAFFHVETIKEVPKSAFYPEPDTQSQIIRITLKKDNENFLAQQLYVQRDKELKNALREALIQYGKLHKKQLTKNQARDLIEKMQLSQEVLDAKIEHLPLETHAEINQKLREVLSASSIF